jgi:phospholipase C
LLHVHRSPKVHAAHQQRRLRRRLRAHDQARAGSAYSRRTGITLIGERDEWKRHFPLAGSFGWYDFTIQVDGDASFIRQVAGHVETGDDSVTDTLLGQAR